MKVIDKTTKESGYADLMPLRVLATIVFALALVAIPEFMDYVKLSKLMPVLDELKQGVEVHYKKNKALPDIERMVAISNHESVGITDNKLRVDLVLIDEDMQYSYLWLQPYIEGGEIAWGCTLSDDIYKDQLPVMNKGICQNATQSLMERSLWQRAVSFVGEFWQFILGYFVFVVVTFIFG